MRSSIYELSSWLAAKLACLLTLEYECCCLLLLLLLLLSPLPSLLMPTDIHVH